ncbi:methylene-tetrahydromethanopterin dehydrogenase [Methylosinus sp. sav-2]|uniref:NAD(P)-dependent methylenetetrahydromethanopterin dehydrogenase n=1 Tax=unclassified Methylosinus TaxID=2624500 RepID=UPI00046634FF|nr:MULTISPECIES: NAD(P)-dependent methylenetetrahydromethanopterin dehydrogenase [unclassified Methylosinus]TDX66570.1 methylene-tetrahydromethanopterin dehydrogenase [Methylosinus sp. sav-2]
MAAKSILHMLSTLKHMSPFDVNMAIDAGFDVAIPYTNVTLDEVAALVQDAMFSRAPSAALRTGIFFAGRDAVLALDMLDAAEKALLKPFEISLFADPYGSFTTAGAMVAFVEKVLREKKGRELKGAKIVVYGATGVVGYSSAVIAALEGAEVTIVGYSGLDRVTVQAEEIEKRFGVKVTPADGSKSEQVRALLVEHEIALCAARAGVQVLSAEDLAAAKSLLIAADVNAVPPLGVEGVKLHDKGVELPSGALGIGALAIGDIKYGTEAGLFRQMTNSDKPLRLDFRHAFALARSLL